MSRSLGLERQAAYLPKFSVRRMSCSQYSYMQTGMPMLPCTKIMITSADCPLFSCNPNMLLFFFTFCESSHRHGPYFYRSRRLLTVPPPDTYLTDSKLSTRAVATV